MQKGLPPPTKRRQAGRPTAVPLSLACRYWEVGQARSAPDHGGNPSKPIRTTMRSASSTDSALPLPGEIHRDPWLRCTVPQLSVQVRRLLLPFMAFPWCCLQL